MADLAVLSWPGAVRARVGEVLDDFLAGRTLPGTEEFRPLPADVIAEVVRDGRRTRSLFCAAGALAGGGDPLAPQVVQVAAGLELFHAFTLIHFRGGPSIVPRVGAAGAILFGDLCLVWSQELIESAGIGPAARPFLTAMRTEAIAGQYLAIDPSAPSAEEDRAWKVTRLRTASHTVQRPLQIGAALAGAPRSALAFCSAFGALMGEACHLREELGDLLGDRPLPGRRSILMSLAWRHAGPAQRRTIAALHGNPALDDEGAAGLRAVIRETGADRMAAELIADRTELALAAVRESGLSAEARSALTELAHAATS
ncbi:polyprenyl synthetase family protein [Actinoplanes sp. NBRC 103695]|uniref:polyprenyl synthetase family protein n=1 Tax=Actinoplanes sp. NBRC 103695 TaxID=3032202 RepID=UPI0024A1B637|nr:polyprenyl synthetase family protein [Actinoplanes sp. NBRC 103695]GLY92809.1 polyprenyl synthetase [Actinoplanes sp. NBRC 103695]